MVNGTEYLVNKEYAKGIGYTALAYVIICLALYALSSNNNKIIVSLIIFVSINILVYITIRNITKGDR